MKLTFVSVVVLSMLFHMACTNHEDKTKYVFIDSDCGLDDLIAMDLLLNSKGIEITGVSCVHGLTRPADGAQIVRRLLDSYGKSSIPVYVGADEPVFKTHNFPQEWIKQSTDIGFQLTSETKSTLLKDFNSKEILSSFKRHNQYLLVLGPLTNVLKLIGSDVNLTLKSTNTVIMGGAIHVDGNLAGSGEFITSNKYAEWNIYCDPIASQKCFEYLSNVTLVPLDATNSVKIDSSYLNLNNWGHRANMLSYKMFKSAANWIATNQYYAWDPLAAAYIIDPTVLTIDSCGIEVSMLENEMGRTTSTNSSKKIKYAVKGYKARFDAIIFQK
jgi:inosine-uridine nucleoside N-ribohydrolase